MVQGHWICWAWCAQVVTWSSISLASGSPPSEVYTDLLTTAGVQRSPLACTAHVAPFTGLPHCTHFNTKEKAKLLSRWTWTTLEENIARCIITCCVPCTGGYNYSAVPIYSYQNSNHNKPTTALRAAKHTHHVTKSRCMGWSGIPPTWVTISTASPRHIYHYMHFEAVSLYLLAIVAECMYMHVCSCILYTCLFYMF